MIISRHIGDTNEVIMFVVIVLGPVETERKLAQGDKLETTLRVAQSYVLKAMLRIC